MIGAPSSRGGAGGAFVRLEVIDQDFHDCDQRQGKRYAPDPEHDPEQDLKGEQGGGRNFERLTLEHGRER